MQNLPFKYPPDSLSVGRMLVSGEPQRRAKEVREGAVAGAGGDRRRDSVDSLKILRFVAGLSVSQTESCPDIGTALTIAENTGASNMEVFA